MTEFATRRVGNLPVEATSFVGRCRELDEINRLYGVSPLVTVTGIGGVGKTRVALRAAGELESAFRDGAWVVELSALRDGDLLSHAIARALRVIDQTTRAQLDVLADHLADKHLLLVLDTCEHLLDACASVAEILLRASPGLRILATSRQPLGVAGEQTLVIHPLATPDPDLATPDPDRRSAGSVARPDAMVLFEQRASAALPEFALTAQNWDTTARLCHRLDGIPLAIELAAGCLRELPLEQVAARLDDRFQLLAAGGGTSASRHQTLRTTIGWSHELCTPQERLLWARLSVFAGDFDQRAAEYVCGDDTLPKDRIPRLLAELVGKSILLREDDATGLRFRLLDTLRDYGAEWLPELGEHDNLRQRHRDWYLRLAEWGERRWFGCDQVETFTRIRQEHANLQAALEFCLTTPGQTQTGMHMAAALWFYWVGCGFLCEGRYWLDEALTLDPEPTHARAEALWVNGYIAIKQGDSAAAVSLLEDCQAHALRAGNETALVFAIHRLGCVALVNDDHDRAALLFKDALARYEAFGELSTSVIMARVELAMTVAFQGDLPSAVELCRQVHSTCERYGERWVKAYALYVLAFAAWIGGDTAKATALAREALEISHTFHDLVCVVLSVELLALLQAAGGHHEHAATLQGAAHQIWQGVGLPLFGSLYFNAPHHECETRARQALGDHCYQAAYQHGTESGLDEAVTYALNAPQGVGIPPGPAGTHH